MLKELSAIRNLKGPLDAAGLDQLQRQIQNLMKALFEIRLIKGQFIDVTFSAAGVDKRIQHDLGRDPEGYLPVRLSVPTVVYNGSAAAAPDKEIILRANAIATVKLWIF